MANAAQDYFDLRQSSRAYQDPYAAGGIGVGGLTQSARYNRQQVGSSFLSAPSGTRTWSGRGGIGSTPSYDFGGGINSSGDTWTSNVPVPTSEPRPHVDTFRTTPGRFGVDPVDKKAYASTELGVVGRGLLRGVGAAFNAVPALKDEISDRRKDRQMYGRRGTGGRARVGQQEANLMTAINPRPAPAAVPDEYEAPPAGDGSDIDIFAVRQPLEQQERSLLTAIGPRPPVAAGPTGDVTITGTYKPERYSPLPKRDNPYSGLREVAATRREQLKAIMQREEIIDASGAPIKNKPGQAIHDASTRKEYPYTPPANSRVQNRRKKP